MGKIRSIGSSQFSGPLGDVYVCDPKEHRGTEETMITILWAPLRQ